MFYKSFSCYINRLFLFFILDDPLAFLRQYPYIQQLRQAIQENPSLLQEIGNTNPQLLQVISQNQEAFLRLLNEPTGQVGSAVPTPPEQAQGGDPSFDGVVHVTPQDKEAIDRVNIIYFFFLIQLFIHCFLSF